MRAPKKPAELRAVTFNGYVGQSPERLRAHLVKLAKRSKADVIALQETQRFHGTIPGYHRHAAGSNVWLIRSGLDVEDRGHVDTGGGTWHGPHGQTQPPHIYPTLRIRKDGHTYRLINVHHATRTEGAGDNRAAEDAAIRDWFARAGTGVSSIAMGDWNSGLDLMRRFARQVKGRVSLFGPDGAVVHGARVVKVRRLLSKYGSDHHRPIVYTFRP